jgi:hypothetical protein
VLCGHAAGGLCTDGAQEMQKSMSRWSVASCQLRYVRRVEPREQAAAELFRRGANGAAVIRVVNLPENYPRVTDLNVTRACRRGMLLSIWPWIRKTGTLVAATASSGEICCMSSLYLQRA